LDFLDEIPQKSNKNRKSVKSFWSFMSSKSNLKIWKTWKIWKLQNCKSWKFPKFWKLWKLWRFQKKLNVPRRFPFHPSDLKTMPQAAGKKLNLKMRKLNLPGTCWRGLAARCAQKKALHLLQNWRKEKTVPVVNMPCVPILF